MSQIIWNNSVLLGGEFQVECRKRCVSNECSNTCGRHLNMLWEILDWNELLPSKILLTLTFVVAKSRSFTILVYIPTSHIVDLICVGFVQLLCCHPLTLPIVLRSFTTIYLLAQ
jgi:hypothetical protein